jgi:hypothetical protein
MTETAFENCPCCGAALHADSHCRRDPPPRRSALSLLAGCHLVRQVQATIARELHSVVLQSGARLAH